MKSMPSSCHIHLCLLLRGNYMTTKGNRLIPGAYDLSYQISFSGLTQYVNIAIKRSNIDLISP